MTIEQIKKDAETRMAKSVETLKADLTKIRTGRASTGLLDHVHVDYYGNKTPLNQVANVGIADARTITVTPWEKNMIQPIEKAILESGLGLNPVTSGPVIRVPLPALTEERRKELGKVVRGEGENAKVAIRNIRRDANTHLKDLVKKKLASEDEEKRAQEMVQKSTDRFIAEVYKAVAAKEHEIMEIYGAGGKHFATRQPPRRARIPARAVDRRIAGTHSFMAVIDPLVNAPAAIPRHIAVILDGNGRWAKGQGLPRIAGHRKGVEMVRELVTGCAERGVRYLTLFAFSSENWRRPETEVKLLMELFALALDREVKKLHANGIRFRVIGDTTRFSRNLRAKIEQAENLTASNDRLTLIVAANYGGRWDIAQACARLARAAVAGEIDPASIDPDSLEPYLSLHGVPEPDLFIRTGGEQRISNFLLWQLAYTELYFTPVLWPDFDKAQLEAALASYAGRERRFGHTSEQIEATRRA